MSDDFDDDSFMVDDSFLAEIDTLTARVDPPARAASARGAPVTSSFALHRPSAGGPSRTTSAPSVSHPGRQSWLGAGSAGSRSSTTAPVRSASHASALIPATASAKLDTSRAAAADARRLAIAQAAASMQTSRPASISVAAASLGPGAGPSMTQSTLNGFSRSTSGPLALGAIASGENGSGTGDAIAGPSRLSAIPSSRLGLGRTSSGGHGQGPFGVQTHLNFRRENQTTRGKRWDRTAFAQSGRRLIKGKEVRGRKPIGGWQQDDDEDVVEDEEDWGEPLAPDPKPLVDTSKPYGPPKHDGHSESLKTYIYPTNRPKRDYQYDIVRACFTDNCLVALPTGLGKTFVAGVVMLNFYRWFPTGKIVFLAPTKPLVNQQIEACQLTCGIPSKDAAVMTGSSVSAKERAKLWDERRVFYCTPQTLDNDLKAGRVDPRDIVLAVFDEAHKASGSYAYTTILALLMAHQPYFRVLALTATPGADVPRVQAVVDALHISRIEIREAEDPAIRKYMNEKHTERHVVHMGEVVEQFRDRWAALMKPYVAKLVDKDILTERDLDVRRLKPFRLTSKRQEIGRDRTSGLRWAMGTLQSIEQMARAMTNLLEFSLGMFCASLVEIAGNVTAAGKKAGARGQSSALKNNYEFQRLVRDVEAEMNLIKIGAGGRGKGDGHPKMTQTMDLLLAHFTQAEDDEKNLGTKNDTRAMVFCSYRTCVLELVDMLNEHSPVLRAAKFVGQSQGKEERDKGFNQKEQKRTINEFKEGKYNILVSTSIGEEGLDIGEVDFVVIYDMPKQSIKLLQRIGRTGRKRAGQVHVLMSEGREDTNWDRAQETHREIQEEILHSRNLELFEDVERLLPLGPLPAVEEREMEVDPWDPEDGKRKLVTSAFPASPGSKAKGKGKAAAKQRGAEVPDAAPKGFRSVAELLREQKERHESRGLQVLGSEGEEEEDGESDDERMYEMIGRKAKERVEAAKTATATATTKAKRAAGGKEVSAGRKKRKVVEDEGEDEDDMRVDGDEAGVDVGGDDEPRRGKKKATVKEKEKDKGKGKAAVKDGPKGKGKTKTARGRSASEASTTTTKSGTKAAATTSAGAGAARGKKGAGTKRVLSPSPEMDEFDFARVLEEVDDADDDVDMEVDAPRGRTPSPPAPVRIVAGGKSKGKGKAAASTDAAPPGPTRNTAPPPKAKTGAAARVGNKASSDPPASAAAPLLDFFLPSGPVKRGGPSAPTPPDSSPSASPSPSPRKGARGVPLAVGAARPPVSPITDESLDAARKGKGAARAGDGRLSPKTAQLVGFSQMPADLWASDDEVENAYMDVDVDVGIAPASAPAQPRRLGLARPRVIQTPAGKSKTYDDGVPDSGPPSATGSASASTSTRAMLPPPIPFRSGLGVGSSPLAAMRRQGGANGTTAARTPNAGDRSEATIGTPFIEPTQFPVRRGGAGARARVLMSSSERGADSPGDVGVNVQLSSPLAEQGGARRGMNARRRLVVQSSPADEAVAPPRRRVERRARAERRQVEQLLDLNADLSGSASSDESGSDLDRETHSDKIFAGEDFAPTQAPRGYDQRAMYRAGLSTQAGRSAGLGFRDDGQTRKMAFLAKARRPVWVSDDEREREDGQGDRASSENEYELGSFVVDDEDDLE